jgi:phosphoribosylanthranilate isomerase
MTTSAKICGITTAAAMDAAIEAGADYVGLVFFAKSPRNLALADAAALAARVVDRRKVVALTVDADDRLLADIAERVAPGFMQLHGKETESRVAEIKNRFGVGVIKAIGVATAADVEKGIAFRSADLILYDAKPLPEAERPGGNGMMFDWRLLARESERQPFMLSGGLTPENVGEAIARTRPMAVDVSSGVESAPGVKDVDRIRRFLRAVKTAKA